jgi:hypothetical protein
MENLNLDIDSYEDRELKDLFNLHGIYNESDILASKETLKTQLTQNNNLGMDEKLQIISFIDNACQKLKNLIYDSNCFLEADSHMIIKNHNEIIGLKSNFSEGREAIDGESLPGKLNPINIRTVNETVNIDSQFRPNYETETSSSFTVELPEEQRKVVKMRIISIELPMTYYSITNDLGNNKALIYCNYKPKFTAGDLSNIQFRREARSLSGDEINTSGFTYEGNKIKYNYILKEFINIPDMSFCVTYDYSGALPGVSNEFDINKISKIGADTDKVPAWLVRIPNGNYEKSWLNDNHGEKMTTAFLKALAVSDVGYLQGPDFKTFKSLKSYYETTSTVKFKNLIIDNSNSSINPSVISFKGLNLSMQQSSGRALFAPWYSAIISTPVIHYDSKLTNHGTSFRWNINNDGLQDDYISHRLKLGWHLGFRKKEYSVGGIEAYSEGDNIYKIDNSRLLTSGVLLSDGVPILSNPTYGYLAISDYTNAKCSKFKAALTDSYLDDDIITKLNLSCELNNTGFTKTSENAGLFSQRNSIREYYGPVNIRKLSFKLYDSYGRLLDLNNSDWSIAIAFEKLYD